MRNKFLNEVGVGIVFLSTIFLSHNVFANTLFGDYLKEKKIDVSISSTLDVYNKYVWRGMLLDDDVVVQPGFAIASCGFKAGFWGSFDSTASDNLSSDEADGYISYAHSFDLVTVSAGHTWYDFPATDLYSKEFFLGFSLDTFLSPSFTYYRDYGDEAHGGADGNYYILGIGHSFDLNKKYGITLDLNGETGYNDAFFISGKGGYYLVKTGLTIPLTEQLKMSPSVGYSVPLGDLGASEKGNYKEQVYAGISMSYSF